MDFARLGLDLGIIAGVIAITEVVKSILPEGIRKFIIILPAILGLMAAVILGWGQEWTIIAKNCIMYVGASCYLFKFGKTVIGS